MTKSLANVKAFSVISPLEQKVSTAKRNASDTPSDDCKVVVLEQENSPPCDEIVKSLAPKKLSKSKRHASETSPASDDNMKSLLPKKLSKSKRRASVSAHSKKNPCKLEERAQHVSEQTTSTGRCRIRKPEQQVIGGRNMLDNEDDNSSPQDSFPQALSDILHPYKRARKSTKIIPKRKKRKVMKSLSERFSEIEQVAQCGNTSAEIEQCDESRTGKNLKGAECPDSITDNNNTKTELHVVSMADRNDNTCKVIPFKLTVYSEQKFETPNLFEELYISDLSGKFQGRTLLKGDGVSPRNIPLTPLYLTHPIRPSGKSEVVPETWGCALKQPTTYSQSLDSVDGIDAIVSEIK